LADSEPLCLQRADRLFLDIVGYSKRLTNEQQTLIAIGGLIVQEFQF